MSNLSQSSSTIGGLNAVRFPARRKPASITRAAITGPANSTCLMYVGPVAPTSFRDGTSTGSQDVSEWSNGVEWPEGFDVWFVWNLPGIGNAYIEFTEG